MKDGRFVILCVDDDPDVLEQLRLVLEANGYAPVLADRTATGLRLYAQTEPDGLIVDLMMDELDSGLSLVRSLKAMENKAPVFLLSSVGDQLLDEVDASQYGVRGVFQKPIEPQALLSTLKRVLKS